ncbi:hypothetical protein Afil01_02740 [Actinorhabdospora filicis]|uniref:Chitinase n=1 Tax=Actinorhabdospora filicis TaxID=1785913 RepID=A0A9W6SGJ6_9ACTN|nr:cellulose binding domain-containing protein [Actinorhabdospora filicis]GLZ75467.1 hypothetical protein Afil01_02740 [Actinorhabdospora filicis]
MRRILRTATAALLTLAVVLVAPTAAPAADLAGPTATFSKAQDWGSGYEAKFTIKNGGTTTLTSWKVEFDLTAGTSVGAYWDSLLTKSGTHHTFANREYNGTVAAGAQVTFGFIVNGAATPANCLLNGGSCAGGTTPGPGTPGTPTVTGTTNTSISLSWGASTGTVTGYRVYEGTTVVSTGAGTTATIGNLAACSAHTYAVAAYNASGESAKSAPVTGTTTGCTNGPGTPGTPTVTGTTNTSISLSWGASTGTVTGYRVYEGTTVVSTGAATTATIGNLTACTSHTYTVAAYNAQGESAKSAPVSGTTTGCTGGGTKAAAPYLYNGWGDPPSPVTVMNATGIKWFTMAFVLSSGGCNPGWDGERPLTGGVDQQVINQIKAAGGNIVPSFGGWQGNKLGPNCSTPEALAGAYQKVIDAYGLKAIDIDIENTDEFENATVQDRILNALKIIEQNNPGITSIVTFGTAISGPTEWGDRLIERSKALAVPVDIFTIMPFDYGNSSTDMYSSTISASEGLKNKLKSVYGWTDAVAYTHMGISGMNGLSDNNELTTTQTWTQIRDWAKQKGLSRLAFWSVNRDRPCPGGGVQENCSGIDQQNWQFTQITAGF